MMNQLKKVNAVGNTDTTSLVKISDYDTKITKSKKKILGCDHGKYNTTQEFNKLTLENFAAKLK